MKQLLLMFLLLILIHSYERPVYGAEGDCSRKTYGTALVPPKTEEGAPQAGKRVRVYLDDHPGVYYVLYLPYNFDQSQAWPVIFESPGNPSGTPIGSLSGLPDDIYMGYGLSKGYDYIWVSAPFLNETGDKVQAGWWGRDAQGAPTTTVNFWLAILDDLHRKFKIRDDAIVIAGFSRGAIADSYIGNWNDEISAKWTGYFGHAHFDGSVWGGYDYPQRLARIGHRKVLLTFGDQDTAKDVSLLAYDQLKKDGAEVEFIEVPCLTHTPHWILENSQASDEARVWLKNLTQHK